VKSWKRPAAESVTVHRPIAVAATHIASDTLLLSGVAGCKKAAAG